MSDPKNIHISFTGDEAYDDDGNHYTRTDPGNAWDTTFTRDDDPDKEHDYYVHRDDDGNTTASKEYPWDE